MKALESILRRHRRLVLGLDSQHLGKAGECQIATYSVFGIVRYRRRLPGKWSPKNHVIFPGSALRK